ncbi:MULTISPECIES: flavin reductase family protein [Cobetia]|uniref:flavin reductase family protein n=1 Tax=Cobetia TaxID=204286 RepID=UPI0009849C2B|nr:MULTISPECIES: flavin reductase family protein [Cobetia]POR04983.1 FMN-binding protein [Cobetia sp. MM1IDA2H-1]
MTTDQPPSASHGLLDADQLPASILYRLFSGSIAPRPIAWVSTIDAAGNANLAPFSFFTVASVNPPVLAFSPLRNGEGRTKDTLDNLGQVAECVIHIGGEAMSEALNLTSASLAASEDEFAHAGLNKLAMPPLQVPRVDGAPIAFGCRLRDIIHLGDQPLSGSLVLAEVVVVHADPEVWDGRHVDNEVLRAIGRMAGSDYARTDSLFSLERPA